MILFFILINLRKYVCFPISSTLTCSLHSNPQVLTSFTRIFFFFFALIQITRVLQHHSALLIRGYGNVTIRQRRPYHEKSLRLSTRPFPLLSSMFRSMLSFLTRCSYLVQFLFLQLCCCITHFVFLYLMRMCLPPHC